MKTNIVQIGNSKGIRLPKAVLQACGLRDSVEIEVKDRCLVIRPSEAPRSGWSEAFASMARAGDDQLLDGDAPATQWDETEWQW